MTLLTEKKFYFLNQYFKGYKIYSNLNYTRPFLLRIRDETLDKILSFRLICLLDTMGKLPEGMILERLQKILVGKNGVSEDIMVLAI